MINRVYAILLVLTLSACGNSQTSTVSEQGAPGESASQEKLINDAAKTIRDASAKAVEISKGSFESKENILIQTDLIATGIDAIKLAVISLKLNENQQKNIDDSIKKMNDSRKGMADSAALYYNHGPMKQWAVNLDGHLFIIEANLYRLGYDIKLPKNK